jgi:hypothetical protein
MSLLDREVAWCAGRTVRELIAVAGGLGLVVAEVVRPGVPDGGNLAVYVVATALLAARFFAARAAAVGACIGAIVQQWPHLRLGDLDLETLAVLPVVGIVLLASGDLVERFERAPSRIPWLPNPWAVFSAAETRALRWSAYAAGALTGLLDHTAQTTAHAFATHHHALPLWPRVAEVAFMLALLLVCLGRAVGVLLVWVTAVAVLVIASPLAWHAESALRTSDVITLPVGWLPAAHYLLPVALLAAAAAAITTPSVARLLRRTLLG